MNTRKMLFALSAFAFALSGPCLPNDYFGTVAASAGVSVISAVLSDILNTVLPPISN